MCFNFLNLTKDSLKYDLSLPHIDVLVDSTARQELLSFTNRFSGCNKILIAPGDKEKATFITHWDTSCYRQPFRE